MGESTARQSAYGFIWPLVIISGLHFFKQHYTFYKKYAKPTKLGLIFLRLSFFYDLLKWLLLFNLKSETFERFAIITEKEKIEVDSNNRQEILNFVNIVIKVLLADPSESLVYCVAHCAVAPIYYCVAASSFTITMCVRVCTEKIPVWFWQNKLHSYSLKQM